MDIVGFRKWSMKEEIFSVGPLTPLTIGLIPCGFLCIFLRKYILCGQTGMDRVRNCLVVSSM